MICLLDLGLFILDVDEWANNRLGCEQALDALAVHGGYLVDHHVAVAWSESFFDGFPWNQPECPSGLREHCIAVTALYDRTKGNELLVPECDLQCPLTIPSISPDLLVAAHLADFRDTWLRLLGGLVCVEKTTASGVAVPTMEYALTDGATNLAITNAADLPSVVAAIPLLKSEDDWTRFLEQFETLDLGQKCVAVLGGRRPGFERARVRLRETHSLQNCFRLPPHFEENRTRPRTQKRLEQVDLLVICTNYIKHVDTEQISNIREAGHLHCDVVYLDNDSEHCLVQNIVKHFREAQLRPCGLPSPSAPGVTH